MNIPIVSLCMPTNGMIEWVFPVLDSIYEQGVDSKLYEIVVTNNGNNEEFHVKMLDYAKKHENLIYSKNDAYMFYNQLEALKLASGKYLKLINHRGIFQKGALQHIIDVVIRNDITKPVIYFSSGALDKDIYRLNSFDEFVRELKRYASWTTGVGIWREDYEKIPKGVKVDKISPHSCILFSERNKKEYLIDNYKFEEDIVYDHSKKGTYDLFKAFAVEEFTITLNLYIDGDISARTLKAVKSDYRRFVAALYWQFVVKREPCSYDLTGFDDSMGIYFTKIDIYFTIICLGIQKICHIPTELSRQFRKKDNR